MLLGPKVFKRESEGEKQGEEEVSLSKGLRNYSAAIKVRNEVWACEIFPCYNVYTLHELKSSCIFLIFLFLLLL